MKRVALFIILMTSVMTVQLRGQVAAAPTDSSKPPKKPEQAVAKIEDQSSPRNKSPAPSVTGLQSDELTTTEIYADEAFFDSTKNVGIFSGRVKVTDPRFSLQSKKLTVFITKGQNQGLEKAVAEGDVGLIRDRPDPNGGQPTRAIGRADKAVYTAATGDVELTGTPRVQQGLNMHVATRPDTVMIINQNNQLTTHGPSRTEIREQPKEEAKEQTAPAATGTPTPSPKP